MRSVRLLASTLALALALPLAACGGDSSGPSTAATVETTTFAPSLGIDLAAPGWTRTSTGLHYRVLTTPAGTSAGVTNGRTVTVAYTGWLANGALFQTSSIPFVLGARQVIAGWDEGIVGMRVGEKRRLLIPPSLGYGWEPNGPIPGNSVLVFDVELLAAT
jgi:FKBP-type peptidyl-prolyl cis-trans isomerase FkpA